MMVKRWTTFLQEELGAIEEVGSNQVQNAKYGKED